MSFNKNHPELKKEEVFLANLAHSSVFKLLIAGAKGERGLELDKLKFRYFRIGNFSYDEGGNFFKGARPIFVSQSEYNLKCAQL